MTLPGVTNTHLYIHDDDKVHFIDGQHQAFYGNGSDADLVLNEQCVELSGNDDVYEAWQTKELLSDLDVPGNTNFVTFRQKFLRENLEEMIGKVLSPRQWQAFNARYFMNCTQLEIAKILGVGVGRNNDRRQRLVQRILFQCLKKLRKKLFVLKEL